MTRHVRSRKAKVLRTFIQITGLILTREEAVFLAKGNLGLSAETIAELSSTKYNYNSGVINSLVQQRADTWIGVILLLLAFSLQMWNALWPMRWDDFAVHKGAAVYALVFSLVLGFRAFFLSKELAGTEVRVKRILEGPPPAQSKPAAKP